MANLETLKKTELIALVGAKDATLAALDEQLAELRQYLLSPKFQPGPMDNGLAGYVNVADVLDRIRTMRNTMTEGE